MKQNHSAGIVRTSLLLAVKSSSSSTVAVIVAVLVPVLLLIGVIFIAAATLSSTTVSDSNQPSDYARSLIPSDMLNLYMSDSVQAECPGLSWTIIASIHHLESNDNRNPGTSSAGAKGASQFLLTTWNRQAQPIVNVGPYGRVPDGQGYALDGDGDGLADIMNPYDSVPAAARYLCANGGGDPATLPQAIYAYNHAWWYVNGGTSDAGTAFIGVIPLAAKLAAPATTTSQGWQLPLEAGSYDLRSSFGMRFHPIYHVWRLHTGVDMAPKNGQEGDPVFAAAGGSILSVSSLSGSGNYVVIDHGGNVQTTYAHLRNFAPATIPGVPVSKGQLIGYIGTTGDSTGFHLHFGVMVDGEFIDPVPWMEDHGAKL